MLASTDVEEDARAKAEIDNAAEELDLESQVAKGLDGPRHESRVFVGPEPSAPASGSKDHAAKSGESKAAHESDAESGAAGKVLGDAVPEKLVNPPAAEAATSRAAAADAATASQTAAQ